MYESTTLISKFILIPFFIYIHILGLGYSLSRQNDPLVPEHDGLLQLLVANLGGGNIGTMYCTFAILVGWKYFIDMCCATDVVNFHHKHQKQTAYLQSNISNNLITSVEQQDEIIRLMSKPVLEEV